MDFPCSKKEFSKIEKKVVAEYLRIREEQAKKHHDSVSQDIGKRIEVTGGKQLNIFKNCLLTLQKVRVSIEQKSFQRKN